MLTFFSAKVQIEDVNLYFNYLLVLKVIAHMYKKLMLPTDYGPPEPACSMLGNNISYRIYSHFFNTLVVSDVSVTTWATCEQLNFRTTVSNYT